MAEKNTIYVDSSTSNHIREYYPYSDEGFGNEAISFYANREGVFPPFSDSSLNNSTYALLTSINRCPGIYHAKVNGYMVSVMISGDAEWNDVKQPIPSLIAQTLKWPDEPNIQQVKKLDRFKTFTPLLQEKICSHPILDTGYADPLNSVLRTKVCNTPDLPAKSTIAPKFEINKVATRSYTDMGHNNLIPHSYEPYERFAREGWGDECFNELMMLRGITHLLIGSKDVKIGKSPAFSWDEIAPVVLNIFAKRFGNGLETQVSE